MQCARSVRYAQDDTTNRLIMKHRIKELIAERGYTQKQMAEILGINRVNFNAIVNGKPTMSSMERIAEILHAEPWELFYTREELIDLAYRETKRLQNL